MPVRRYLAFVRGGGAIAVLVFLPVYALASIVAASVLHYVVEKPFLLLKDRTPAGALRARVEYAS